MFKQFAAALLALSASVPFATAKDVFAHMIIGNTASYTTSDWQNQIALASQAGISGFALNIAKDQYTSQQLGYAYDAAEKSSTPFKMFISFDYAAAQAQGGFSSSDVVGILKQYASRKGQYQFQGKPLVSTFEGPNNKGDWTGIKQQVDCFFMPDWSSLGPQAAASVAGVDGLFSWDAWPTGNADTPVSDQAYINALAGKPYMKPISPWFYTNLQSKNWLWRSDSLWHKSWSQALSLNPQPPLIELLTWNDFGESSYLAPNPTNPSDYPSGSQAYAQHGNHSAWLSDLPFYINAYKNGGSSPSGGNATAAKPHVTFWHRLSPASACASTGTPCGQPGQQQLSASQCDTDGIFFTVFPGIAAAQPQVSVSMGGTTKTVAPQVDNTGAYHGNVSFTDFGGKYGPVTVSVTGAGPNMGPVTGDPISESCTAGWNAFVASSA